jgi:hypothetical protein
MITITREIQDKIRAFLEAEYKRRGTVGNRTLETAFARALESSPVQEAISTALDIFIE